MTHDEIISFFKSNKNASKALGYGKGSISSTRFRGVSKEMQIRAFSVSQGALKLDEDAQRYFDFLMNKTGEPPTQ